MTTAQTTIECDGRQTFGMGVWSVLGFIPTDVVFARTIPSSGWKFSNSARVIASPPTLSASILALSSSQKKIKLNSLRNRLYLTRKLATSNQIKRVYGRFKLCSSYNNCSFSWQKKNTNHGENWRKYSFEASFLLLFLLV